jgi:hypothetical protein
VPNRQCPTCQKSIPGRKDNFERHIKSCHNKSLHTQVKNDAKRCEKCDKSFLTKQHLNRHLKTKKHKEGRKRKADTIKIPKKKKKSKKEEWEEGYAEEMEEDDNWELPTMVDFESPDFPIDNDFVDYSNDRPCHSGRSNGTVLNQSDSEESVEPDVDDTMENISGWNTVGDFHENWMDSNVGGIGDGGDVGGGVGSNVDVGGRGNVTGYGWCSGVDNGGTGGGIGGRGDGDAVGDGAGDGAGDDDAGGDGGGGGGGSGGGGGGGGSGGGSGGDGGGRGGGGGSGGGGGGGGGSGGGSGDDDGGDGGGGDSDGGGGGGSGGGSGDDDGGDGGGGDGGGGGSGGGGGGGGSGGGGSGGDGGGRGGGGGSGGSGGGSGGGGGGSGGGGDADSDDDSNDGGSDWSDSDDGHDGGNDDNTPVNSTQDNPQPNTETIRRCSFRIRKREKIVDGTPRTEARRDHRMRYNRRTRSVETIAKVIKSTLKKITLTKEEEDTVVIRALRESGMLERVLDLNSKVTRPRGITRTSDETIILVWRYWNDKSTISNSNTGRPAKCAADEFDQDPLLKRIDLSSWNVQTTKTKRNKRQYSHQYQVQDATQDELFRNFKEEHPGIKIGLTTFVKLKPFYVRKCKPSDIETCSCRTHVNFRNAVEALIKHMRNNDRSATISFDGNDVEVTASYRNFMLFLYKDCVRDDHGILVSKCETGECKHWNNNWVGFVKDRVTKEKENEVSSVLQVELQEEETITFQRFEYEVTEKFGRKLAELNTTQTVEEVVDYISSKMAGYVSHSTQRTRDYIFWKIWEKEILPSCTFVFADFAENLSLPIQKEPQSLYWIRKQISLHGEIIKYRTEINGEEVKIYSAHVSDDRDHDQVYVRKSLDDIIQGYPVNKALVVRSDNAQHFKSAENFDDLQQISNKLGKTVVRVFGIAGHGKGEIDSCGGHMKNPVREAIANKIHITTSTEAVDFLNEHYEHKISPCYDARLLSSEDLQEERERRLYKKYYTVKGSDSFHVLVFTPNSTTFLASNSLCVCTNCIDMCFERCAKFSRYEPLVGQLSEKATRSKAPDMVSDENEISIAGMVRQGFVFAVKAVNQRTNFFLLICSEEEKEHMEVEPFIDECGNKIYYGTKYLQGKYLEVRNFTNKYHEYSPTTKGKTVAVVGETVFFPQVPIMFSSRGSSYYRISNEIVHELQVRSTLSEG